MERRIHLRVEQATKQHNALLLCAVKHSGVHHQLTAKRPEEAPILSGNAKACPDPIGERKD